MRKGCLSEDELTKAFDEESTTADKSHYKRRSFVRKIDRIPPAFASFGLASRVTKILNFAEFIRLRN